MPRTHKRHVQDAIKSGKKPLKVVGSQKTGFSLAVEVRGEVRTFGQPFKKQSDAVQYGADNFGVKAVKKAA